MLEKITITSFSDCDIAIIHFQKIDISQKFQNIEIKLYGILYYLIVAFIIFVCYQCDECYIFEKNLN